MSVPTHVGKILPVVASTVTNSQSPNQSLYLSISRSRMKT